MRHSNVVGVDSFEGRVTLRSMVVPSHQGHVRAVPTNQRVAVELSGHAHTVSSVVRYAPSHQEGTSAARFLPRARKHNLWATYKRPAVPASHHIFLRLFRRFSHPRHLLHPTILLVQSL
jgi:hypothetical protein